MRPPQLGALLEIDPYLEACQRLPDDLFSVVTREPQEAVVDIKNLPVRQCTGSNCDRAVTHELGEHGVVGLEWTHPIPCGIHSNAQIRCRSVRGRPRSATLIQRTRAGSGRSRASSL